MATRSELYGRYDRDRLQPLHGTGAPAARPRPAADEHDPRLGSRPRHHIRRPQRQPRRPAVVRVDGLSGHADADDVLSPDENHVGLVSRPRGSWHKSRSAAPGWQGATSENTGSFERGATPPAGMPGNYVANHGDGTPGRRRPEMGHGCRRDVSRYNSSAQALKSRPLWSGCPPSPRLW